MRLPPLPQLRVRNPNKPEPNPCLGVMTSVLGKHPFTILSINASIGQLTDLLVSSLLGLSRLQWPRLPDRRGGAARVHGRPAAAEEDGQHYQLPSSPFRSPCNPARHEEQISELNRGSLQEPGDIFMPCLEGFVAGWNMWRFVQRFQLHATWRWKEDDVPQHRLDTPPFLSATSVCRCRFKARSLLHDVTVYYSHAA